MAKIRYLTDLAWQGQIRLICSIKTARDLIFRDELNALQQRFPNLQVTVTATRETDPSWQGQRGRISPELLQRVIPNLASCRVHLCGPTEMTEPVIEMLRQLGVPDDQIKSESFASPSRKHNPAKVPSADLPGKAFVPSATATLEFTRSGRTVNDLQGQTILEIAETAGIEVPYECRAGVCVQCKVRLLQGNIVMDNDDALDSADRAQGLILCYQSRCVDGVLVDA